MIDACHVQDQGDLTANPVGFRPGSDRYSVDIVKPSTSEGYTFVETVSFDPAQPTTTMQYDYSPPVVDGEDGSQYVDVPGLHARAFVDVAKRAPVSADIKAPAAGIFFTCGGRPIAKFELACFGDGEKAEVGALTVRAPWTDAAFRLLGTLPGKPFTGVYASPDGKRLLAQRADGFYALPATGGTPKKVFGDGTITVLSWSGSR